MTLTFKLKPASKRIEIPQQLPGRGEGGDLGPLGAAGGAEGGDEGLEIGEPLVHYPMGPAGRGRRAKGRDGSHGTVTREAR